MSSGPCHTKPFVLPGVLIARDEAPAGHEPVATTAECCDYCGSASLAWRKCKLICTNCHQINKSCADL